MRRWSGWTVALLPAAAYSGRALREQDTSRRVVLDDWIFDLDTGELVAVDGGCPGRRLPPQPTKLLSLLIAKKGTLLGRDEIKAAIWPDVEVDFDQSLSFCVRQVRTALEDTADAPRYVETLPRRGYRLLVSATPHLPTPESAETPAEGAVRKPRSGQRSVRAAVVIGVAVVTGALLWLGHGTGSARAAPIRLAIMPFAPPAGASVVGDPTRIAFALLTNLGTIDVERLAVLGPTTTEGYARDLRSVRDLVEERSIDYVMNGRFLAGDAGVELLAELIRGRDGAHVWVERYVGDADWSRVAVEIERALRAQLGLPPRE